MTTIKQPVRRETRTMYRGRPLVVELRPTYLLMREKGRRTRLEVDYGAIYDLAQKIRWRLQRAEKEKAKGRAK